VVIAARRKDELVALAQQIEKGGGEATYVVTGVSVAGNVEWWHMQSRNSGGSTTR